MSINVKTKDLYESLGYVYAKTEHWNAFCKRRVDLFGFADAIAFLPGSKDVVLIQITSRSNASSRRNKINTSEIARAWMSGGRKIHLVTWEKKSRRWEHRLEVLGGGALGGTGGQTHE